MLCFFFTSYYHYFFYLVDCVTTWRNQIWLCWPCILCFLTLTTTSLCTSKLWFKANYSYILQVIRDTNTKVSMRYKIKVLTMVLQVLVKHHRQPDTNQRPAKGSVGIHAAAATSTGGDNGNGGGSRYDKQWQWQMQEQWQQVMRP